MIQKSLKVVFFGTPDFAKATLEAIYSSNHQVVGCVTLPDKKSGRGQKIHYTAVKEFALEHNIPLLQPLKFKNEEFLADLRNFNADIFVVVAFRILPEEVFSMPPLGTFNVHASLLPKLRGASPIHFAIINKEKESGVTTFLLDKNIDTGTILLQEKVALQDTETVGSLYETLQTLGASLAVKTLDELANNTVFPKPQPKNAPTSYAPKISKEFCNIDWSKNLEDIDAHIRGLSPYPAAYTYITIDGKKLLLKIYQGTPMYSDTKISSPSLVIEDSSLYVVHPQGKYKIEELQLEGKKRLKTQEFINGLQHKSIQF